MTASLVITQTSAGCIRYRLVDSAGTVHLAEQGRKLPRGSPGRPVAHGSLGAGAWSDRQAG
jgi:hypothetical protein